MSYLPISGSFEYLCYASTVIINIFYFYCVGIWESDVYRRQILTTKVYPRAVRVNVFLKVHVYLLIWDLIFANSSERIITKYNSLGLRGLTLSASDSDVHKRSPRWKG